MSRGSAEPIVISLMGLIVGCLIAAATCEWLFGVDSSRQQETAEHRSCATDCGPGRESRVRSGVCECAEPMVWGAP